MMKLLILAAIAVTSSDPQQSRIPAVESAYVCFLKGSYTSGMNRICLYDCLGSTFATTVGAAELCPLTLENNQ